MPNAATATLLILECIGAVAMLALMQLRTQGANFATPYGRSTMLRRVVYAGLAAAMAWHVYYVLEHNEHYDWTDVVQYATPITAVIVLAVLNIVGEHQWSTEAKRSPSA